MSMITFTQFRQRRHDTLYIHHHGLYSPGIDGQLLLQDIPGNGQSVTQQNLIGRTADTGKTDTLRALCFCQRQQLRDATTNISESTGS